jgi:hypothetical protein
MAGLIQVTVQDHIATVMMNREVAPENWTGG